MARVETPAASARRIEAAMRRLGTRERAEGEKKYLKSDLTFLGTTMGDIRRALKEWALDHQALTHDEMVATVEELWKKPVFERRMVAVVILSHFHTLVGPRDLGLIERLIRESRTWALVDALATDIVGNMMMRHPNAFRKLDRWSNDADFWVRRAAMLALLRPLKAGGNFEQFAGYADKMLEEKEFFIRKAIGWVLREVSKKRPDIVWDWLAPRAHRASGVTMREAVKYLDSDRRTQLMNAYRNSVPTSN